MAVIEFSYLSIWIDCKSRLYGTLLVVFTYNSVQIAQGLNLISDIFNWNKEKLLFPQSPPTLGCLPAFRSSTQ